MRRRRLREVGKMPDYNDERPGCNGVLLGPRLPSGMGPGDVPKVLECLALEAFWKRVR